MTQEEKDSIMLHLQCKHGVFGSKLSKALSTGSCSQRLLDKNTFVSFSIGLLRRFTPFKEAITNGYKIVFKKVEDYNNVNISIGVNDGTSTTVLASYSGSASLNYILSYLQDIINNGTSMHYYYAELNDNVLYLYSYAVGESFDYTLDLVFTDDDDNDSIEITSTSIEEITSELLDLWNCISLADFNKIAECVLSEYQINNLTNT